MTPPAPTPDHVWPSELPRETGLATLVSDCLREIREERKLLQDRHAVLLHTLRSEVRSMAAERFATSGNSASKFGEHPPPADVDTVPSERRSVLGQSQSTSGSPSPRQRCVARSLNWRPGGSPDKKVARSDVARANYTPRGPAARNVAPHDPQRAYGSMLTNWEGEFVSSQPELRAPPRQAETIRTDVVPRGREVARQGDRQHSPQLVDAIAVGSPALPFGIIGSLAHLVQSQFEAPSDSSRPAAPSPPAVAPKPPAPNPPAVAPKPTSSLDVIARHNRVDPQDHVQQRVVSAGLTLAIAPAAARSSDGPPARDMMLAAGTGSAGASCDPDSAGELHDLDNRVVLRAEGHPFVHIFVEPATGATLAGEVPSGSVAERQGPEWDRFVLVNCGSVFGWVWHKDLAAVDPASQRGMAVAQVSRSLSPAESVASSPPRLLDQRNRGSMVTNFGGGFSSSQQPLPAPPPAAPKANKKGKRVVGGGAR